MPEINDINESVYRKIQLLLNLGSRTEGNEQEAATAMAKAQELLAKYNLEMAEVQARVVKGGTKEQEPEKREKTTIRKSAMYNWQQQLCKCIAEANFCFYWVLNTTEAYNKRYSWGMEVQHRKVKRHMILGRQSNVIAVQIMYEYLVETIERILPWPNKDRLSKSAISWREGCAERLMERIVEKYQAMRQEKDSTGAVTTTAIVLQTVDKAEYAANYDATYGEGAYARKLKRDAEWEQDWNARQKAKDEARQALLANETPAQRRKREAEEAKQEERDRKAQERAWKRYEREQERAMNARDWGAYYKGRSKGNEINLSDQISDK